MRTMVSAALDEVSAAVSFTRNVGEHPILAAWG